MKRSNNGAPATEANADGAGQASNGNPENATAAV